MTQWEDNKYLLLQKHRVWGKLWVILTRVTMTMWKTCLPFHMTSSALIGLTSLALACTTPLLYLLFQAAGYFSSWLMLALDWNWVITNSSEFSDVGPSDSGSSEETLRKMLRWLPRLASQMWWCWCRCSWSNLDNKIWMNIDAWFSELCFRQLSSGSTACLGCWRSTQSRGWRFTTSPWRTAVFLASLSF